MMRLKSDLVALCQAALAGELDGRDVEWDPRPSMGVVLAAGGYPADYPKGDVISGLEQADSEDVKVFHAGTKANGNDVVTNGGRVLCVTALGSDLQAAQRNCYEAIKAISWEGMNYRRDIGWRAL
jgi:phosphoribosylamine--glycine ligase